MRRAPARPSRASCSLPKSLKAQRITSCGSPFSPVLSHLWCFSVATGAPGLKDRILTSYLQFFFVRHSTVLPYEVAASFALLLVHFLHRALVTRRLLYLLLFAETIAVISALHPGVLIVLFPVCLLVAARTILSCGLDCRTFLMGSAALSAALVVGNLWLVQIAQYGMPGDIGAAAPILDRIFHTRRAAIDAPAAGLTELQLVDPSLLLGILALGALLLLGLSFCCRDKELGVARGVIPLFALGTLFLYFMTHLGLPRLVDQSRLQTALALSYGLMAAQCYWQFVEQGALRRVWREGSLRASRVLVGGCAAAAILVTPRFIDSAVYRLETTEMELPESSYFVYKIEDTFQPFSYTVVSYAEGFPLLVSQGYHMNTQDLLTSCSPVKR